LEKIFVPKPEKFSLLFGFCICARPFLKKMKRKFFGFACPPLEEESSFFFERTGRGVARIRRRGGKTAAVELKK